MTIFEAIERDVIGERKRTVKEQFDALLSKGVPRRLAMTLARAEFGAKPRRERGQRGR